MKHPLLREDLFTSITAHWHLMKQEKEDTVIQASPPPKEQSWTIWMHWMPQAKQAFRESLETEGSSVSAGWWAGETYQRILALESLLRNYLPWTLPEFSVLCSLPGLEVAKDQYAVNIEEAAQIAEGLYSRLSVAHSSWPVEPPVQEALDQFFRAVEAARENLRSLADQLQRVIQDSERLAQAMDFTFLVNRNRRILSIGFNVQEAKLHDACYDMLASEARTATFLAIARGDLPYASWFRLSRDFTRAGEEYLLLSWTGTMFEYLMPALWMRSYPNTLLSQTLEACVRVQKNYGEERGIPWGISESGAAARNDSGHYHYHA